MSTNDTVSVIIPAYNAEATIGETLASASAQTYPYLEVIVVDDGSTDRTAAIVEAAAARDTRIRLLRKANDGVASARNLGIKHARGGLIAPLDADDLWHPDKITKQVAVMQRSSLRPGVVYALTRRIDERGCILGRHPRMGNFRGEVYAALVLSNFISNGSVPLIRRDCIEVVGGYDTSLHRRGAQGCEDYQLYLALAERYKFDLVPEFLVGYRYTAGSMSLDGLQMLRSQRLVITEARRRHPELPRNLFRWAEATCCRRGGKAYLRHGRFREGMALLTEAVLKDPIEAAQPLFVRSILASLARWLGLLPPGQTALDILERYGLTTRWRWTMGRTVYGQLFLSVDPSVHSGPGLKHWERRRLAYVASLRIKWPPPEEADPVAAEYVDSIRCSGDN